MNSFGRVAVIFVGASLNLACSSEDTREYRPLAEGEAVRLHVLGYTPPWVIGDDAYEGSADGYIENPNRENEFGVRVNADGVYRPDTFVVNNGVEENTLGCVGAIDHEENNFLAAWCHAWFVKAEPGRAVRIEVNEFADSVIVMPEIPVLTSPKEGSEFSVSSGEELVLSWGSLGNDDSMEWSLDHLYPGEPGSCEDKISWHGSSGDTDDTGSFVIPTGELPTDLPPEGCPAVLSFSRGRRGTLDPGIKLGSILGRQQYKMKLTLKP